MNKKMIALPMLGLVLAGGVASTALAAEQGRMLWSRGDVAHKKITLTDEQKAVLEEARTLHQSGDTDGAKSILKAAELKDMGFHGKRGSIGNRHKMTEEMSAKHEEIKAAIEANDYSVFHELAVDTPFADLTEAQFAKFIEAHELHDAGDHKAAREIMDELGLKPGHHKHSTN